MDKPRITKLVKIKFQTPELFCNIFDSGGSILWSEKMAHQSPYLGIKWKDDESDAKACILIFEVLPDYDEADFKLKIEECAKALIERCCIESEKPLPDEEFKKFEMEIL